MEGVAEGKLIIFSLFKLAKRWRGPLGPPILTNFVADCRMASVKKQQLTALNLSFQKKALLCKKKATIAVITVSLIYAICWVPVLVMYCLAQSLPNMMVLSHQHKVTILLAMFNSSINPVVYSFTSARFRKHLVKLLRCKCYSNNSEKQLKPLAQRSQPTASDGMWTTRVEKQVSGACMKLP